MHSPHIVKLHMQVSKLKIHFSFLAGLSIDAVTILRTLHECYFEQVRIEWS